MNTALCCPHAIAVCIARGCTPILRILFIVALNRTQNAPECDAERSSLCTSPLLILAEGRRNELVREDDVSGDTFSGRLAAPSRTSPLLRPLGRTKTAFWTRGSGRECDAERSSLYTSALLILAEGRRSELVREDDVSGDIFSGRLAAPSRTSPLLRPLGRTKTAFWTRGANRECDAARSSLCASARLILAEGRSELVREDDVSGDTFSGRLAAPSRTSPLPTPVGQNQNGLFAQGVANRECDAERSSLCASARLILAEGRRSELVREDDVSGDTFSGRLAAPSRTSPLLRALGRIKTAFCPRGSEPGM